MATRPRRNHAPAFKAKAALAAVRGERTLVELAQQFDERPNQITRWRNQLLDGAAGVFDGEAKTIAPAPAVDVKTRHAKIGGSDAGERFFVRRAREGRASERKAMIDRQHDPPLSRQAKVLGDQPGRRLLSAPRGSGRRSGPDAPDRRPAPGISLRRQPDVAGPCQRRMPCRGARLHVATLMRRMGVDALYRRSRTSKRAAGQRSSPICCASCQ